MRWESKGSRKKSSFKKSLKSLLGFSPKNLAVYKKAFRHLSAAEKILNTEVKNSNERLEFLGDAVLDMVVAEMLFRKFPFKEEGYLTDIRSRLVSRKQLATFAENIELKTFLEVNGNVEQNRHIIRGLAGNALEALIGAIYLDRGYKKARTFIETKLMAPYVDFDDIESLNVNYKSMVNQWAQKQKKDLKFAVKTDKEEDSDKKYTVALLIDGVEITDARHYSKKTAEKMASRKACSELNISGD
jgi:ribonuclease-3